MREARNASVDGKEQKLKKNDLSFISFQNSGQQGTGDGAAENLIMEELRAVRATIYHKLHLINKLASSSSIGVAACCRTRF